jgi:RNA polymerase sigma-70 factor (ECF subfamily)
MSSTITRNNQYESRSIEQLIGDARQGDPKPLGELLRLYRNYLTILATTQFDERLRRRMNPSDLVQDAMLGAHRDFPQFRGCSEREFLKWLRQILINSLHHAVATHVKTKKRDARRDVSLDQMAAAVERSAERLANGLADRGTTPSAAMQQRERSVALADQLARLKPEYREVIVLRNLQGLPFDEVAQKMHRKQGTVRMLWMRAIQKFKEICEPIE